MRVGIIGHFGYGENLINGQTIKTKIVTDVIVAQLGKNEVLKIDTHGGAKILFKAPFQVIRAFWYSRNIIIFPAHNGLRVYVPLMSIFRKFFKNRKIHYVVIGGWLPDFIKNKKLILMQLKKFNNIYVETNTMKKSLEEQGFKNIVVMPNCKNLNILKKDELVYNFAEPLKLCTFSRVMNEKGISDAVDAVRRVNEKLQRIVYKLDIYGQVDEGQKEWFDNLQDGFPEYVKYCGVVPYDKSVDIIKNYFALLFPTKFYTEGIPGTVIDAYAAGVPVIASKWESFSDVIDDGITGIGYEFSNLEELISLLMNITSDHSIIETLKQNCIEKAENYTLDRVAQILRGGIVGI